MVSYFGDKIVPDHFAVFIIYNIQPESHPLARDGMSNYPTSAHISYMSISPHDCSSRAFHKRRDGFSFANVA